MTDRNILMLALFRFWASWLYFSTFHFIYFYFIQYFHVSSVFPWDCEKTQRNQAFREMQTPLFHQSILRNLQKTNVEWRITCTFKQLDDIRATFLVVPLLRFLRLFLRHSDRKSVLAAGDYFFKTFRRLFLRHSGETRV